MRIVLYVALLAGLVLLDASRRPLTAQVTNTNCFSNGVQMQCTSIASPPPTNFDSLNRSNVAALGGIIASIKAKRARHAAEKQRQADSARFAQPAQFVPLYSDSAMTVELDTATLVRHDAIVELRATLQFTAYRPSPNGIMYNGEVAWAMVDCSGMRYHTESGMFFALTAADSGKAVDVLAPQSPDTWTALSGPLGAAIVQRVCGT
jgi:hypothetical protein